MIFDPEILRKYRYVFLKLRAISGSSRFYILNIVRQNQRIHVGKIVDISSLDQPIVSQLLSILKKAEFVTSEKINKEVYYEVNTNECQKIIAFSRRITQLPEHESDELNDNYPEIMEAYKRIKLILNPGRMILLEFIERTQPISVNELVEMSKQSQSIVSQNLGILRNLNLVTSIQDGRWTKFSIVEKEIEKYTKAVSSF